MQTYLCFDETGSYLAAFSTLDHAKESWLLSYHNVKGQISIEKGEAAQQTKNKSHDRAVFLDNKLVGYIKQAQILEEITHL